MKLSTANIMKHTVKFDEKIFSISMETRLNVEVTEIWMFFIEVIDIIHQGLGRLKIEISY